MAYNDLAVPYIGITDFNFPGQARYILERFKFSFPDPKVRFFMIGLMMSKKTLNGESSPFTSIWPRGEELQFYGFQDPSASFFLHWADYRAETTLDDLRRALDECGEDCKGLQFDMSFPNPIFLEKIVQEYGIKIVLQIGREYFKLAGDDPQTLLDLVEPYQSADYFLLDKSMGEGKGLDAHYLLPFIEAMRESGYKNLSVGGGLGQGSMNLLEPFEQLTKVLSWDAQGKLHIDGDITKPSLTQKMEGYIRDSKKFA